MMHKKILWKDAWKSVTDSLGRFIAIALLMLVSAFTFIGLKMAGPDMRSTAQDFYSEHQLADLTVTSNYGLNSTDRKTIKDQSGVSKVSFGYFQDSTVNNTKTSLRVFSNTKGVSTYQVTQGQMPQKNDEIAVSYLLRNKYHIGQTITLNQYANLKNKKFKIVGFVRSSEYTDKNDVGQTTVGTGQLSGIAVVKKSAFDTNIYTIARILYAKTRNMNPYSTKYQNYVDDKQDDLQKNLNKNREAKYQSKKAKINDAQAKINNAQDKLKQIPEAARVAMGMQIKKQEKQIKTEQSKVNRQKDKLAQVGYPEYNVNDRTNNPGYTIYRSNSERVDVLANVFPIFLFAIAALVSLSTMTRFVDSERINIGTLKALGYSNKDASKKFILYSLLSSVPGVLIGAVGGYIWLPKIIFHAYAANSTLSGFQLKFSGLYLVIALIIAILCTAGAALVQLWSTFKTLPAELLLPKPPKNGSRILLERITPLWNKMSFNYKVTARNLFRYKTRMLMTIFGVAGCTALLVMGFGIRDSLKGISDNQYTNIIRYNMVAVEKDNLTSKQQDKFNKELDSNKVKRHKAIYYEQLTKKAGSDNTEQKISMIVPKSTANFNQYIKLHQRSNNQNLQLSNKGVIISEKLADLVKAKVGSDIRLKDADNHYQTFHVAGITEMYMGHFVIMNQHEYHQIFDKKYHTNAQLITLRDASDNNIQNYSDALMSTNAVKGINLNMDNEKTINNIVNSLNTVIAILIGIATILAIVVIYTLTNTNVEERIRELSTLKVLGFYDNETTLYIYRETIILSILGILIGYLIGNWLHEFVIVSLPPTNAMFDPNMYWTNYCISVAIPIMITALLAIVVYRRIKTVNMLDALKSVD